VLVHERDQLGDVCLLRNELGMVPMLRAEARR
jgi:hypothetical protein